MNKLLVLLLILLSLVLISHNADKRTPGDEKPRVTFGGHRDTGYYQDGDGKWKRVLNGIQIEGLVPDDGTHEVGIHVDESWDCYFEVGKECMIGPLDVLKRKEASK